MSSSPTPTRAAPLYRGRESGRHVGSAQGWTPTALLEHPGRDSSRGGPGSSGGPEDNLLRLGRPLPGRLPTGQPQFPPPRHSLTPAHAPRTSVHTHQYTCDPRTPNTRAHTRPPTRPPAPPHKDKCANGSQAAPTGSCSRMQSQDKDAEEGCGSRRFSAGARRGRGRAPDRGCRCCQGDAGWRRRALRLPPPPRLPRVPVGAAPPPPTRARRRCAAPPNLSLA